MNPLDKYKYLDYPQAVEAITKDTMAFNPFAHERGGRLFAFFTTNLANFLPDIPYERHVPLLREWVCNQWLGRLEQEYFAGKLPIAVAGWDEALVARIRHQPGIVCTMHTGSYRLPSYLLGHARIPFALVVSRQVVRTQGDAFRSLHKSLRLPGKARMHIVEADSPGGVRAMAKLLKQGYQLLIYIDGDMGASPVEVGNLTPTPFLGRQLLVRRGVPFLSARLGVPIHPLLCFRRGQNECLEVIAPSPIVAGEGPTEDYIASATAAIYGTLAEQLRHRPAQWENWPYLHRVTAAPDDARFAEPPDVQTALSLLTPVHYAVFAAQGKYYLIRKIGYKTVAIAKTLYDNLVEHWYGMPLGT
ncbi:lysophospholipid acyltransferase family protein [Parapedobacter koreensis]|uniref:Lauroyl/myristoyl acyltransferase n=1 Tax=Parapedobacter koreensis TaxID=332977 RepID=A0A1H7HTT5_9SPHI|nr:hypothetical protein [Parapedobacter koreensis]SEK53679.1 Lauroyl/myristoyl acyltransferase [Parapedobacter koreensis]